MDFVLADVLYVLRHPSNRSAPHLHCQPLPPQTCSDPRWWVQILWRFGLWQPGRHVPGGHTGSRQLQWMPSDTLEYAIYDLERFHGWTSVWNALIQVLADENYKEYWFLCICIFWNHLVLGRDYRFDSEKTIAAMYLLASKDPVLWPFIENTCWGIVCKLKGLDYLDDYDPRADKDIVAAMRQLQA